MFKDNILQGKKILVTGGGTGLGKEMSEHYIQHGADVVICGRRESVLAETAEEFKEKYLNIISMALFLDDDLIK